MTQIFEWLYACQFDPDLAATADFAHGPSYRIQGFTMVYLPADRPIYNNSSATGYELTAMGYTKPSSYVATEIPTQEVLARPYLGDPRVVACYAPLLKQLLGVGPPKPNNYYDPLLKQLLGAGPCSKECYLVRQYLQRAHPDLCGFGNPVPPRRMTDDEVLHYLLVDQMDKSLEMSDGYILALLQGKGLSRSRRHEHAQRDLIKLVKQVARKERDEMRDICERYGYPASPLGDTLKLLDSFYTA